MAARDFLTTAVEDAAILAELQSADAELQSADAELQSADGQSSEPGAGGQGAGGTREGRSSVHAPMVNTHQQADARHDARLGPIVSYRLQRKRLWAVLREVLAAHCQVHEVHANA